MTRIQYYRTSLSNNRLVNFIASVAFGRRFKSREELYRWFNAEIPEAELDSYDD